ncbi:hypothetical protein ACFQ3S_10960 [Mucilaginibacter terrae]|uniref:phosphoribosyltransferase-like protein n=1 Tax=Mucilaginibacter terrae TaxID=1955052 RepID=UPI00362A9DA6
MDYQQFLDEKVHQLRIVCLSQWDYLKYSNVSNWLEDNFKNDIEGKYYATKILLHTLYYSKKDLEKLLLYGLNEKIYGELLKSELIRTDNIYIQHSDAETRILKLKQASFFIPLSDSDKPQESGNAIVADLVHKLEVPAKDVDFVKNVDKNKLLDKKYLIFVDDCIGSGDQLRDFLNSPKVEEIKNMCQELDISIYYLALVGYQYNVEELIFNQYTVGVRIRVCDLLTEKNRVFSDENVIWASKEEKVAAVQYFKNIESTKGIDLFGHGHLDFAIILHNRVPDWSLPIFWKEMTGWKCLIKRKNTYT